MVPSDIVPRGARASRGARVRDHRVQEPRDRPDARGPARPAHPEALALVAGTFLDSQTVQGVPSARRLS